MKVAFAGSCGHGLGVFNEGLDFNVCGYCPDDIPGSQAKFERIFAKLNITPERYENYKKMIEKTRPDVLVVDSVFCHHAEIACFALEQGVHVYCEKPMALTLDDCDKLEKARKSSGKLLRAMQTLRYEAPLYTLRRQVEAGKIGEVRLINAQKSYKLGVRPEFFSHRELYGGTIPWVTIHMVDGALSVYPKKVLSVFAEQSQLANNNNGSLEMTAICGFKMENEVLVQINTDYLRPATAATHGDDRLRVVGTKGVIELLYNKVYITNDENDGTIPLETVAPPSIFQDFLAAINGQESGIINEKQSLQSTRVALLLREAADTKSIIKLDKGI